MSLINDALKQARQAPPRNNPPNSLPPLQPAAHHDSSPTAVWLVPAIIIVLVFAAIFFIGWAVAHRTVHDSMVSTPIDPDTTQQVETVAPPVAPAPVAPVTVAAPDLPKLQGIFYSPTAPSAILDGKTVSPGDQFKQFKVKAITKYTVILVDTDKKEYTVGMGE